MSVPGPVIIDLDGKKLSAEEINLLKHPMTGGVMIFFKNVDSPDQLKTLIANILEINPSLSISVDREGGNVQRLQKPGFRNWPAARIYGETYDREGEAAGLRFAEYYGKMIGEELAALKISINAAPVVDLHSDSDVIGGLDRAFHTDPAVVTKIAAAFIKGLQASGVRSTIKHFPDHGICKGDSHTTKPVSDISLEKLEQHHMVPFIQLAKTTDAIMPAHITFTQVDPDNAVGYSKIWLDKLRQYGFNGVIMSDCLSMAGASMLTDQSLKGEALESALRVEMSHRALKALNAGCNMIIMANQKRDLVLHVLNDLASKYKASPESNARIAHFLGISGLEKKLSSDVVPTVTDKPSVSSPVLTLSETAGKVAVAAGSSTESTVNGSASSSPSPSVGVATDSDDKSNATKVSPSNSTSTKR